MEKADTPRSIRHRYGSEERAVTKGKAAGFLEIRIQKLEKMCKKLQQHPRREAGVSSEELVEILMTERGRLKASLDTE